MGKTYQRVVDLLQSEFSEKKVTKYSFCKQTGINPTSIERYLCGISEPSQGTLDKLSSYFGVSVEYLRGSLTVNLETAKDMYEYTTLHDKYNTDCGPLLTQISTAAFGLNAANLGKVIEFIHKLKSEQI